MISFYWFLLFFYIYFFIHLYVLTSICELLSVTINISRCLAVDNSRRRFCTLIIQPRKSSSTFAISNKAIVIAMKLETACECECRFRYRRGHGYLVPFLFPSIRLKNIKSHVTLPGWYEACGFIWFHDCHKSTIWCKNSVVLWIEYLTYPQKTLGVNGLLSIYRFTKVYKGLDLFIK